MAGLDEFPRDAQGRLILPEKVLARFWAKVDKKGPDECWIWKGARLQTNHGHFKLGSRPVVAHRVSYAMHTGPIPDGFLICHRCDNRPCVNPKHLFLGTAKDNVLDRQAKGRTRGFLNPTPLGATRPSNYKPTALRLTPEQRFWLCVEKTDTCWLWTGNTEGAGYGGFKVNGKQTKAHRFSYELHHGPIPDGLDLCHKCDNPPCVRPDHLFIGTHKENSTDMMLKGRHPAARFNEETARQALALYEEGWSQQKIAEYFGVSHTSAGRLIHGERYSYLAPETSRSPRRDTKHLSDADLEEILRMRAGGSSLDQIAAVFAIPFQSVSAIVNGQFRGDVGSPELRAAARSVDVRGQAARARARITEEMKREIRRLYATGLLQRELAERFGVKQAYISHIIRSDPRLS